MKDLTPQAMRCRLGWCPSVGQLEDGRLLIVGKIAPWLEVNEDSSPVDRESWPVSVGTDETAVIIDPALLDDVPRGWRTIDNAPRDGTNIDVWCPEPGGGYRIANAWWCSALQKWRTYGDSGIAWAHEPTHWRPLPLPPTEREGA